MKVLVSCPNGDGWVHKHVAQALALIQADSRVQTTTIMPTHSPYVHNLHLIREDFLAGDFDFWLSMDDDNPPRNNPLDLVLLMEEHGIDIMGLPTPVWANMKPGDWPGYWNALDYVADEDGWKPHSPTTGLQEVDAIGSGCFIVSREVMEKIPGPFMRTWENGLVTHGGDYSFCKRAKKMGFRIFAHYGYPCRHFCEIEVGEIFQAFNAVIERKAD